VQVIDRWVKVPLGEGAGCVVDLRSAEDGPGVHREGGASVCMNRYRSRVEPPRPGRCSGELTGFCRLRVR
jgi:hypothetical protein